MSKIEIKATLRMLQAAPNMEAVIDSLQHTNHFPDSSQISTLRQALWEKYLYEAQKDTLRAMRFEQGLCQYEKDSIGRFGIRKKGECPEAGYPLYIALHGGGGGPQEMNDAQWKQMQSYYLSSIDTGIYIAPRGPNNTWNLHFDAEAQSFYTQLIQDAILYGHVDPNRVYLLGYSAGGDGVYQLAPRLGNRLAAASMSAGHHNGVSAQNLQHVPLLLQVGELDSAYHRHQETVRYTLILDDLEKQWPGSYRHAVFVHAGAQHSYVRDRFGAQDLAPVIADPRAWLFNQAKPTTDKTNTDAVVWMRRFVRNPFPSHVQWDAATRLKDGRRWYWVSVPQTAIDQRGDQASYSVRAYKANNTIEVLAYDGQLDLHLHEALIDPKIPVTVIVDGQRFTVAAKPSMLALALCLKESQEPQSMTWQTIHIVRDAKGKTLVYE